MRQTLGKWTFRCIWLSYALFVIWNIPWCLFLGHGVLLLTLTNGNESRIEEIRVSTRTEMRDIESLEPGVSAWVVFFPTTPSTIQVTYRDTERQRVVTQTGGYIESSTQDAWRFTIANDKESPVASK